MKQVFGYSDSDNEFVILSHAGFFFLRRKGSENNIAKSDNELTLRAWIDGYSKGKDIGSDKWFNKYLKLKQFIENQGLEIPQ
jgi:hypothetical protein